MAGSEPAEKVRLDKAKGAHERLLIEAAQHDPAHFAELYEKYFEVVYAYVARRVRERTATEDVTAEVFHKALQHLPRFKWTGAPFAAWLFRIASNLVADRANRKAREGSLKDNSTEPLLAVGLRRVANILSKRISKKWNDRRNSFGLSMSWHRISAGWC